MGWEVRDSGIGAATGGLGGVRFLRPAAGAATGVGVGGAAMRMAVGEFTLLVCLVGAVAFEMDGVAAVELRPATVAIPPGSSHPLTAPSVDCELLEVALPG